MSPRVRNLVIATLAVVIAVAGVIALVSGGTERVRLTEAEADAALEEAGCEPVDAPELPPNHIIARADAESAAELYDVRPPTSGPHFRSPVSPLGFKDEPVDERAVLQNLERGAVVAWYDPAAVDDTAVTTMRRWVEARNRAGFAAGARGGAGIIVTPYPDDLEPPAPVALRAWHRAVDCETFDRTAADAFLARNFGTRGESPNATLAGYPEEAVQIVESEE